MFFFPTHNDYECVAIKSIGFLIQGQRFYSLERSTKTIKKPLVIFHRAVLSRAPGEFSCPSAAAPTTSGSSFTVALFSSSFSQVALAPTAGSHAFHFSLVPPVNDPLGKAFARVLVRRHPSDSAVTVRDSMSDTQIRDSPWAHLPRRPIPPGPIPPATVGSTLSAASPPSSRQRPGCAHRPPDAFRGPTLCPGKWQICVIRSNPVGDSAAPYKTEAWA